MGVSYPGIGDTPADHGSNRVLQESHVCCYRANGDNWKASVNRSATAILWIGLFLILMLIIRNWGTVRSTIF